jgi:uncharacterized membrane protein YraQ (UPF0718 family)
MSGTIQRELRVFLIIAAVFLAFFFLPVDAPRVTGAIGESLLLTQSYAREHVLLCLLPAFLIAGAIGVFLSQSAIMRYLGPGANKLVAYGVASVSGTILAVCSCTVLPLFAGIYRMGAGLGPASAFLYSGPAINVLAIILTARILGIEMGIARAVGAVAFSVVIGLFMHLFFRREDAVRTGPAMVLPDDPGERRLGRSVLFIALLVGILVFANWSRPLVPVGLWSAVYDLKWIITAGLTAGLGVTIARTAHDERRAWIAASWGFAKQILPLLFIGVLVAGALLGRPGHEGLIPSEWVTRAVGGNSLGANFAAAVGGAFMYFATLTEVPILQGLMGSGMGKGPALALLLAGPAVSLPSMLVLRSILGLRKTLVYVTLVVVMSTFTGFLYGALFG